jgi:hypothetical protein
MNSRFGLPVSVGFGLLFALFLTQGLPYWDDDFTSWFWKVEGRSLLSLLAEWIWPVSTQPEHWGFNERPAQAFLYKLLFLLAGYDAAPAFFLKSAAFAWVGWRIAALSSLLSGGTSLSGRAAWGAAGAAFLFYTAPGPVAALILQQDFAPYAALANLILLEWIFHSIEATPRAWRGIPSFSDPGVRKWMSRWLLIALCTYLAYKTKADVKLIAPLTVFYVALVRRAQWAYFALPLGLMLLLAVPWGPGIFSKLPPFVPGSGGSEVNWMFQEARLSRVFSYLWSNEPVNWARFWRDAPLSLAAVLGPFALLPAAVFAVYRIQGDDHPLLRWRQSVSGRAWVFFFLWWCGVLLATGALSDINFTFRIRYGILTVVPTLILLGGLWQLLLRESEQRPGKVGQWLLLGLALQVGMNVLRSVQYRRDMGSVMVAVDQAYSWVARHAQSGSRLLLSPDFRPYDYRPGAPALFRERVQLSSTSEFAGRTQPGQALTVSWSPSLWPEVELLHRAPGCQSWNLFDALWPCDPGGGAFVMRWIGPQPLYDEGERLRQAGKNAEARALHEKLLQERPEHPAARFVIALESFALGDPERARTALEPLEEPFFRNNSVLYNLALARAGTGRLDGARELLEVLAEREPGNYGVLMNLQDVYGKLGKGRAQARAIESLKRQFPNDGAVQGLR